MNGLLEFMKTPGGQGLLGAVAGYAANAQRGTPVNNLGRGGLSGLLAYGGAQDRIASEADGAMKRGYMQSQMDENTSQIAQRAQAIRQQAAKDAYFMGTPGANMSPDAPTSPGAYQAPAFDGVGPVAPMPTVGAAPKGGKFDEWAAQFGIPKDAFLSDYNTNGGKGIAAMLEKRGTPNMKVANGYAYDENKLPAGFMPSFTTTPTGQGIINRVGADGLPVSSIPKGALESFAAYKGVDSGMKPIKVFNPETQREEYTSEAKVLGVAPATSGAKAGYATEPQMKTTVGGGMGGSRAEVLREIKQTQADLMKPMDEASKTMLREHLAFNQQKLTDPRYTDTAPKGNFAAGPSAAEATASKVAELKATEQVKADVTPTDAKISKYESATDALKVINQVLAHPGLNAGTGLQGKIDPRNYMPGTDAKDFQVMREQLKGTAFLKAYESLKGSGSVSEIEGAKAEAAVARINNAQSTAAFTKAMNDYKDILNRGLKRAGTTLEKEGIPKPEEAVKSEGQAFDSKPPAQQYKGKTMTAPDGKRYQSDGMIWKAVQ